ncbi:hypothetical protein [Novosphingobium sp. ZW T3_23]|uniref:hypothetical protein n=1 Tax=Novosphingobium sp. ZW T3_23 TaxID=3378084 RepID=UPI0038533307
MTKEVTNHTAGARGINLKDGSTVWVEPGQTLDISGLEVKGKLPDFGKPSDQAEKDADEVIALRARIAELEAQVGGGKRPSGLAGKSKAELLDIAKAEGVTIEDNATNEDIKSAIELAREEKAQA